ncbi:phosphoglycerate mutase family protein [Pseudomethylobacillus aquaticus]|uniref:Phosphoglycerate mutase family protein n=1 Tax=Pseudomethylobacillus aquaticus TaxID=2676064 RepID=A0A3N0V715_9PROT|nr:phosphoglycerate mutase family protein [Pseudomethylobacillus aquaticus]
MRITLIRHAESRKNLVDVIGGIGERLTFKGRLAAHRAGRYLKQQSIDIILYAPTLQTEETAGLLSKYCNTTTQYKSPLLSPIGLGSLAGLRVDESKLRYPSAMESLHRWNRREIEISEVVIPGMQDIFSFFCQGLSLLFCIHKLRVKNVCVVATRSSLVLMKNIKLRNTPESGGGYLNHHFRYAHPISFRLTPQDIQWIRKQLYLTQSQSGILEPIKSRHLISIKKMERLLSSTY